MAIFVTGDASFRSRLIVFLSLVFTPVFFVHGDSPVLRWNPVTTNLWDATSLTWLDSGDNAVAWQSGALAQFTGSGGIVNIADDVSVSNITFSAAGYALLGTGRLTVEGSISVAAETTNSIAAELCTVAGVTKTGGGALAVTRCRGPLTVTDGALLVSSRETADADISVANGATLHVLGGPATGANLIANPSFEVPALASGAFSYTTATLISNWTVTALANFIGRQNTAAATAFNSAGAAPDLNHVLIIQYNGSVAQTVTVASDGLYALSFYHFLRNNYPETPLHVYLGGARLTCVINQAVQFAHQRYVSAPLFLKAGAYELRFAGDGGQGDRANMIDLVCFAPPSETVACGSLTGLSTLRAATGSTVRMAFSGTAPLARVYIDGTLQAADTFTSSHASGIFVGVGSLVSAAPQNISTWTGSSGNWNDIANWESASVPAGEQGLALRFPLGLSGTFDNDISGAFMLNRLWATGLATNQTLSFSGNSLLFTNTAAGVMPSLTFSGAGAAELTTPIAVRTNLLIDCADRLTLSGTLDFPLANAYVVSKSGPGTVTLSSTSGSPSCYMVYDGRLNFSGSHTGWRYIAPAGPFASIPAGICLNSLPGKSASFYVTQTGTPVAYQVFFAGLGEAVFGTRSGGVVTCDNWFTGFGTAATYDVGVSDTLRILQLIEGVNDSSIKSLTGVIKAGPGIVEIRSLGANNTTRRAYSGSTVIRNGTLILSADDCGTLSGVTNPFNGQTYTGLGGSLGYSLFSNTVRIGDSGTAASDNLALIANGNGRYIGHDIEVFNKGSAVTLGMTTGTVMFAGTVTLHRDIVFTGPADGVMIFSNVVAAADFSGTGETILSGLSGLRIEGTFPSVASLIMEGRSLRFGTSTVKAQTLTTLSLGTPLASATLDVDFGAGVNDLIAANSLTLSNTVVNLYCAGSGLPFAEPGTYTLFTYAGTLGGDTSLLTVGNPQSGVSYVFANDAGNHRVTLTLSGTAGGVSAVWKNPVSGNWDTGSNWDSGDVPDGTGVVTLFGLAITNPATVNIGTARTVGGLLFNNASYGYTLAGNGGLTFATNGATPLVSVLAGGHTLNTTLDGSDGLQVSTASGAALALGTNALVKTSLALTAGTLNLDGATAQAPVSQASGTTVGISKTNTLSGGFSGADSATLAFSGTAPKLTVSSSGTDSYGGTVNGAADARLEKSGSGTLTLSGGLPGFKGTTAVLGGTLGLRTAGLSGAVTLTTPGTVSVAAPVVQGLMGYYFNRSSINTNDFSSLAVFKNHLITLTPDFAALSGLSSNIFNFGFGAVAFFPQPYGSGGSRTTLFEAAWQGKIRIPVAGRYRFRLYGDDGFVMAIDGTQIIARNLFLDRWEEGDIDLDAGLHDILIGYYQINGNYGLKLEYTMVNNPHYSYPVSNSWLVAESRIGTLSGNGSVTLPEANSALNVDQSSVLEFFPAKTLTGTLNGDASSAFSKSCSNQLTVTAATAFNGQFRASEGIATVSNGLGSAALAAVNANAVLQFVGSPATVAGLSGPGLVSLNGAYAYAVSGDAGCGISTAKTYTHLLDFPADGTPATINGVTFIAANTNGTANGYSWSIAGTPFNTYSGSGTGLAGLTADFYYNCRDFTITLSGLTPGQAYEFRLYFKAWGTNKRLITYTFSTGSSPVDMLRHVIDSLSTYSIVGFRYTADAAGTASIRVQSHSPTDGYHLYGLSNEENDAPATGTLTVAPAADADWALSGALGGSGTLIKSGEGSQTLGGTVTPQVSVQGGTLAIGPSSVLAGGAEILAGGTLAAAQGGGRVTGLSGAGALSVNSGDTAYLKYFNSDGTCEISTSKTYTHKLDFGTGAAGAICGVTFTKTSAASGTANGYGWSGFPTSTHVGNENVGISVTNTVFTLLRDMNYGIMNNGTMTLTGLTPGKRYEMRFYNRVWGAGTRSQILTFDPDGTGPKQESFEFNPDLSGSLPNFVGYRYTAESSSVSIFLQAVNTNNMSLHLYGMTNEELPADVPLQIETPAGSASVFDGIASGYGTWSKTGAGLLTLTGANTVGGALAVAAGTLSVDGGTTGAGAVTVASGATVCGNGRLGGDVTIASNAVIHAGTSTACGTLAVGGNLTLVPGAVPAFRFSAGGEHDVITVDGRLSFPSNGVVQASALAAGVPIPSKALFLSSPLTINGPSDFSGWTVEGVGNATLKYSDDGTKIYFFRPCGILIMLQ